MPAAIRPELPCGFASRDGDVVAAEGLLADDALEDVDAVVCGLKGSLFGASFPKLLDVALALSAALLDAADDVVVEAAAAAAFGGSCFTVASVFAGPSSLPDASCGFPTFGSGSIGDLVGWSQIGFGFSAFAPSATLVDGVTCSGVLGSVTGFASLDALVAVVSAGVDGLVALTSVTSLASRSIVTGSVLDLEWRGGFPDTMTTSF
jgi:hypothetical protein